MFARAIAVLSAALLISAVASADEFSADWHVVAGGGGVCSGGEFTLMGTSGQVGVDHLAGGEFALDGGFWPGVPGCFCPGDMTGDNKRNGADVQAFVKCLINPNGNCLCADVNLDAQVNMADVAAFVNQLLAGGACP